MKRIWTSVVFPKKPGQEIACSSKKKTDSSEMAVTVGSEKDSDRRWGPLTTMMWGARGF